MIIFRPTGIGRWQRKPPRFFTRNNLMSEVVKTGPSRLAGRFLLYRSDSDKSLFPGFDEIGNGYFYSGWFFRGVIVVDESIFNSIYNNQVGDRIWRFERIMIFTGKQGKLAVWPSGSADKSSRGNPLIEKGIRFYGSGFIKFNKLMKTQFFRRFIGFLFGPRIKDGILSPNFRHPMSRILRF